MKNITVEIASPLDRENLVAEIWQNDAMIAEINTENNGNLEISIYSDIKKPISINYEDFINALIEAKNKLVG